MMDAGLPQLEQLLDPHAMLAVLAERCLLPQVRPAALSCRIALVRHKPGKNCLVQYEVELAQPASSNPPAFALRQTFCARAYAPGQSEPRWQKAQQQWDSPTASAAPVTHVPELGLVVWAFPNERKLRGLGQLLDSHWLETQLFPPLFGSGCRLLAEPELIRYIPEHGCTVRLSLTLPPSSPSQPGQTLRLYGKAYADASARQTYATLRALGRPCWLATENLPPGVEPILWQAELPGRPATLADAFLLGQAVGRLHSLPLANSPHAPSAASSPALDLAFADQVFHSAERYPQYPPLRAELLRRLAAFAQETGPARPLATLHGDLHLKNLLVVDGPSPQAELIDLDTVHRGEPLVDLGSLLASWHHRVALGLLDASQLLHAEEELLRGYATTLTATGLTSATPPAVDRRHLAAFTALALVRERACRAITRRKGDVAPQMLRLAAELLDATATAPDLLRRFSSLLPPPSSPANSASVLDVDFRCFTKSKSWPRTSLTLVLPNGPGQLQVRRFGHGAAQWQFPDDPEMPWLRHALASLPGASPEDSCQLLHYRPHRRATFRVRSAASGRTFYGKCYADPPASLSEQPSLPALVVARVQALRDAGCNLPPIFAHSPSARTVWQEAFPGQPLRTLLSGTPADLTLVALAGQTLAQWHQVLLPPGLCAHRETLPEQAADLTKKLRKLAVYLPQFAARLSLQAAQLSQQAPALAASNPPLVLLHGDCHSRQFMYGAGQMLLFDFDEMALGDPAEDLANFLADLFGDGLVPPRVHQLSKALLEGYARLRQPPVTHLHWHLRVRLLTRAYRSLLQLKPSIDQRVEQHLQLAEAL